MILRIAKLSDIATCGGLDASYTSDYTWQISQERSGAYSSGELSLDIRPVRLPRARSVIPPDSTDELEAEWNRTDLFIVAEEEEVIAYLCCNIAAEGAWIRRLVVDKPFRRAGVGGTLLESAREWGRENDIACLLAAVPTKNHPAIALFRSQGYNICGFNERHFPNRDIALYLAHDIDLVGALRDG